MKRNLGLRLILMVGLLAVACTACEFSGNTKTSKGERAFFNEDGFSFTPPAGTIVGNTGIFGASVEAAKSDKSGDTVLGPVCSGMTNTSRNPMKDDPKSFWAVQVATDKNNTGLDLSAYQETDISGIFALEAEETGAYLSSIDANRSPIYGKVLDVQLDSKRIFTLNCDGPLSRKDETLSLYEALKGSLQFFDPITSTPVK